MSALEGRRTRHEMGARIDCSCPRYVQHRARRPISEFAWESSTVSVGDVLGGGVKAVAVHVWHRADCRAHGEPSAAATSDASRGSTQDASARPGGSDGS